MLDFFGLKINDGFSLPLITFEKALQIKYLSDL